MPKAKKQPEKVQEVTSVKNIENEFEDEKQVESKVKLLDKCLPYNDKLRLMIMEVLREECGRELATQARINEQEFSWASHNAQFREDYSQASLKELLSYCSSLYGLRTLDEIRERRYSHKNLRTKRNTNDIEKDDDDDIDLD